MVVAGLTGSRSSLVDDCGLRMALGSILGPEVLGVAGGVATWNVLLTYVEFV